MVEMIGIFISVPLYAIGALLLGATVTASLFMFHVAIVPLVFKYSKTFRRSLVFANFVQWPLHIDFERPSKSGVDGARNLTVEFQSQVDKCHIKLGVWHILPKSVYERLKGTFEGDVDQEELNKIMDEELRNSKTPIMLYCHGNSNSRATSHRILLYKFFQKMEFHTIAFDYRGYGDSTHVCPSESGVVEDSVIIYEWLMSTTRQHNRAPPIFVWGHSLGTGISSAFLSSLPEHRMPRGLILEAPFSNMADEVEHHPLSKVYKYWIWLSLFLVNSKVKTQENTFSEQFKMQKKILEPYRTFLPEFEKTKLKKKDQKESINWQLDINEAPLSTLMSDLENTTYQKCLGLANYTLNSNLTSQSKTLALLESKSIRNCFKKEKWSAYFKHTRKSFNTFYNNFGKFQREIPKSKWYYNDCNYYGKYMTNVPKQDCYWNKISDQNNTFWNFWNNYGPEFLYTYDFILYSEYYHAEKENKLWYLVGYLKFIAMEISNPHDIIEQINERNRYKQMYDDLNAELTILEGIVAPLVPLLNTIISTLLDNTVSSLAAKKNKPTLSSLLDNKPYESMHEGENRDKSYYNIPASSNRYESQKNKQYEGTPASVNRYESQKNKPHEHMHEGENRYESQKNKPYEGMHEGENRYESQTKLNRH